MSQPTQTPQFSLSLTAAERDLILAFVNVGFKAEISRVGLGNDAGVVTVNALHILKKLSEATPLEVLPPETP